MTARKPRPTRAEQLQKQWNSSPRLLQATIIFRPFRGWFAEPDEVRHFNDEGDLLGRNWIEAKGTIEWLASDR